MLHHYWLSSWHFLMVTITTCDIFYLPYQKCNNFNKKDIEQIEDKERAISRT